MLDFLHDPQTMPIVLEPPMPPHQPIHHRLAFVPKRRVTEVMRQGNRFGQGFVEPQGACDVSRNRRHFDGVGESSAIVIARTVQKYLSLVLQPAEGA